MEYAALPTQLRVALLKHAFVLDSSRTLCLYSLQWNMLPYRLTRGFHHPGIHSFWTQQQFCSLFNGEAQQNTQLISSKHTSKQSRDWRRTKLIDKSFAKRSQSIMINAGCLGTSRPLISRVFCCCCCLFVCLAGCFCCCCCCCCFVFFYDRVLLIRLLACITNIAYFICN